MKNMRKNTLFTAAIALGTNQGDNKISQIVK